MESRFVKIKEPGLAKLNNKEYSNFMTEFHALAFPEASDDGGEDPDDGGSPGTVSLVGGNPDLGILEEEKVAFEADLEKIQNLVERTKKREETARMNEVDEQRTTTAVAFTTMVKQLKNIALPAQAEAVEEVHKLSEPYVGLTKLPTDQKTAQIDGLLKDMSAEGVAQKVETMGLTPILNQLREQNELYRELSRARREARTDEVTESSDTIRERMNFYYDEMTTAAFVQSAANPTETNKRFIALLNTLIDETKQKYNLRKGIAEANEKKEEEKA